jgi:hypothetical protein
VSLSSVARPTTIPYSLTVRCRVTMSTSTSRTPRAPCPGCASPRVPVRAR